ncbi:hypothetical protein ACERK3_16665 [Phycisphaerales bacterium AB-hyl4]|uniref:Yip1 domain-containing protein n=1 Tax=Natronomicrosphaera hydrolytica TaxID=3242702 RepID=A0ABV4UBU6_9BACT
MQCRTCGYALWNLSQPRCPECGDGFDLRSYRYRPGTVAFACPHCQAHHAGQGDQYLPANSDEATCSACGQTMAVTHMSVVPLSDDAWAVEAQALPWDNRRRVGFWRAWWRTFVMVLLRPTQLVDRLQPDSSYGVSYLFAFVCHLLGAVVQTLTCGGLMLIPIGIITVSGNTGGVEMFMMVGIVVLFGGLLLVSAAITPLLATLLVAGPAHLMLWLIEPKREQRFLVTARLVNYALAPAALMAVPIVGFYCGQAVYIWTLVAAIIMLSRAHHTHGGKATLAVLWLPGTLLVGYLMLVVVAELIWLLSG